MPKKTKKPYWFINLDEDVLNQTYDFLLKYIQLEEYERKAPIILKPNWDKKEAPHEIVKNIVNSLANETNIKETFCIKIVEDKNSIFENRITHIVPVFPEKNQDKVTLYIKKILTHNLPHLIAEIAHSLAFVLLEKKVSSQVSFEEPLEKEFLADILAIIIGFGIIICNTREWKKENVCSCGRWYSKTRMGFINLESACYIQAKVSCRLTQNFKDYKKYLYANPKQFVKQAIKYLDR